MFHLEQWARCLILVQLKEKVCEPFVKPGITWICTLITHAVWPDLPPFDNNEQTNDS